MAIMGFNPAAEMSQLRTQTLAMQATSSPAAAPAAAAAAPAAAAPAGTAATDGATADAAAGAAAVQPPQTSKIILQSVLKGAMTGVSVTLGVKQFGPMLGGHLGFLGKLPTKVPPSVGSGLLGFLGKLPVLSSLLPAMAKSGWQGFAITALVGAAVGGIFGAVTGLKKAKAAAAEYAEAMAAQQAQTPPPATPAPSAEPAPETAPKAGAKGKRAKSWIISRTGSTSKTGGSFGTYTVHKGETLAKLAERFHTTEAEMRKLNPDLGASLTGSVVAPGTKLKLKRKVVPDAQAWVG